MEDENINMVQVRLGSYLITVDQDTAEMLENDSKFAQQYLQQLSEANLEPENSTKPALSPNKVWTTSRNQSDMDRSATLFFLALRKTFNQKFADKTTSKNSIWNDIAKNMNEAGFFVGYGTEGREKCRQKFVNLQSSYIKYKDKKKSTGEGRIEKPPFFEELDLILSNKDKVSPTFLLDSCPIQTSPQDKSDIGTCTNKSNNNCIPSTSMQQTNRFAESNIKVSVAPKKNQILEKFYLLAEKSEKRQEKEFKTVVELMREESQKRHEQIMSLISAMNNDKKRKRRDSTDD